LKQNNFRKFEQYQDRMARLFPEFLNIDNDDPDSVSTFRTLSRTVTFQVTDACNLACTYCYQINKSTRKMSLETAKKFVDYLLDADETNTYINPTISPAIIIEFIGGEPFLEIELIEQVCEYFEAQAILRNHPWVNKHMFSICSNGTLYEDPKVKNFLVKYADRLSFSITIDGNKELHDACRVFHDGRPSYDICIAAVNDWVSRGNYMGSKLTIAPENLQYLYDAVIHMIGLGYVEINANVVYEKGWEIHHATEYYWQLIRIADYLIENNLMEDLYVALFEANFFKPKKETDINNWCGGTGMMLSCDPDGFFYPCIRYMESSLGDKVAPMRIGHVDTGLASKQCERDCISCLNCITRKTQSTDECFNCPIAEGCSWCSAYNYQEFGTPDKRATYICCMHKARALANAYYYSQYSMKTGKPNPHELHIPEEWALDIIPDEEWKKLKKLYDKQ
jgi:radical SAM peptide maturase (CXXX-repeat target family)